MRISVVLAALLALVGCSEPAPDCHFSGKGNTSPSAGCLVVSQGKLLLVETNSGKFGPPAGTVDSGESSQCGAERETWEETGVEVAAGEMYHRFPNGFRLYWCEVVGEPTPKRQRPLEVASVGFYALEDFDDLTWRFPSQVPMMKSALSEKIQAEQRKQPSPTGDTQGGTP